MKTPIAKSWRVALIVITDVLVLSILPAATVPQIIASTTLLLPLSMGIQSFSTRGWHFDVLDGLMCVPYIFLLGLYLQWTSLINILGNLFILIVSALGVYAYANIKQEHPTVTDTRSDQ